MVDISLRDENGMDAASIDIVTIYLTDVAITQSEKHIHDNRFVAISNHIEIHTQLVVSDRQPRRASIYRNHPEDSNDLPLNHRATEMYEMHIDQSK
jgi:hypothetical protein